MKKLIIPVLTLSFIFLFFEIDSVFAGLKSINDFTSNSIPEIKEYKSHKNSRRAFLLIGILLNVFLLYGAYLLTSPNNENKEKGREIITSASIGIVLTLILFALIVLM